MSEKKIAIDGFNQILEMKTIDKIDISLLTKFPKRYKDNLIGSIYNPQEIPFIADANENELTLWYYPLTEFEEDQRDKEFAFTLIIDSNIYNLN